MEVTKKIIDIEVNGVQTVKELKQEISSLRDKLLNVEQGSEDYNKVLNQLIEDEKKLTSVMQAGKKEVHAAAGSYNALQQEMTSLKRVWKEVQDEASRNEIGKRINDINNQLKDMDASIGVFNRNVGDYRNSIIDASKVILGNLGQINPALGNIGKQISSLIPLINKTTQVATKGLTGVKAALVSTGIGALIVALGLLVANWDKVSEAISRFIPWMKKSREETEAQVNANNDLLEANKAVSDEIEFQSRVMKAQGATTLEVLAYKRKETEALLANTEAQIAETQAKIESLKAHGWLQRLFNGENKQIRQLEESLKLLTAEQDALSKSVKKLNQDITVETITIKNQSRAVKDLTKDTKEAVKSIDEINARLEEFGLKELELIELQSRRQKDALTKRYEEEKALLIANGQDTTKLTAEYISNLLDADTKYYDALQKMREQNSQEVLDAMLEDQLNIELGLEGILDTEETINQARLLAEQALLDAQKQAEREALQERLGYYQQYADALSSVLGSVADAWENSIQTQLMAGEITEKEAEKQFENVKAIQTAQAVINTIAGVVAALTAPSLQAAGPFGWAAAIAQSVAIAAAGAAQIAKIQSTKIGTKTLNDNIGYAVAQANPSTEYTPQYSQNITGQSETDNLANALVASPLKAYVVESDISRVQKRAQTRNIESTY